MRSIIALFLLLIGIAPSFAASECFTVAACGAALSNPYTAGQFNACTVDVNGNTCTAGSSGSLPTGATPIVGVFSGADTTTAAATLAAAAAGHTTYICGFTVSGLGSTGGGPVTVTVTASTTLSYSYVFPASATTASTPLAINYSPCLPATATATAITVTVPGQTGNTATQINASGYQL